MSGFLLRRRWPGELPETDYKQIVFVCTQENPCKHPVIIFRNVKFEDLVAIVDFMYHGEVNVEQEQLSSFLTTAEMLAVQGLTDGTGSTKENYKDEVRDRILEVFESDSRGGGWISRQLNCSVSRHLQNRKKQSLLESSLLGGVQDLSNNRSANQQKSTPKLNIPSTTQTSFYSPPQSNNRPTTPTGNRKRRASPVKVVNSISNKDAGDSEVKQSKKKVVLSAAVKELDSVEIPLVPKVEVNDFDDNDSSYSEQESGLMDVSQLMDKSVEKDSVELFNTNSRDSPHPVVKNEGVPASEIGEFL